MSTAFASALRREFGLHRDFLWGLCYRMTGSAADAEDLVQDTFERALRSPPPDSERSLRPWLARVALNLSCDHLRRRKLAPYRGSWLPEPVPTESLRAVEQRGARADARYDLLESTTFAFLLAGRYFYGWRGRQALRWTLAGFVMLLLAYVGSRFVMEVILGRG